MQSSPRHVSLSCACLLLSDVPVQTVVHAEKPIMRCIQLAHSRYGVLAHVDQDCVPWGKPLPVFTVKGAPHLRAAVCRDFDPDLNGLWQHQGP